MLHIVLSCFILIFYYQAASCEMENIYQIQFGSYIQENFFDKDEVCFQKKPGIRSFEKNSNDFFQKDDDNTIINAWVATGKTVAYACLGKDNMHLIPMRNTYKIVVGNFKNRYKNRDWSLLTTYLDKKIVGWVDHDSLILKMKPIKNSRTNLYEKVLIKAGDAEEGKALTIFTDKQLRQPETYMEDKKKNLSTIKVRAVFYVFDYYPHSSGSPSSEETISLLVNPNLQLNINGTNEPMLLGWVNRKNVTFWNNREVCEAEKGSQIRLKDSSGSIIFTGDIVKQLLPYNDLRNPILQKLEHSFKIGIFTKLDRTQKKLKHDLSSIQVGMEVLFIIDGTRSMTKAFKGTLVAVKEIASELEDSARQSNLEQPRFAAMFYRDTPSPGMNPVQIIDGQDVSANWDYCRKETFLIPMRNLSSFISKLSKHKACDCDTTIKESVYKGIIEGIDNCGFQSGHNNKTTRLRVIIHIGDAGDNGRINSTEKVYSSIINRNIFKYIAMDVSENDDDFTNSIRPVLQKLNERSSVESILEKVKIKGLKRRVLHHLEKSKSDTESLDKQIKILSRGFAGSAQGTAGVVSKKYIEYAKTVAEAHGIDINNYNPFQDYIEGYIDINSPIIKYLLVTSTDIQVMTNFLSDLNTNENDTIETRRKLWNAALKIIIGEDDCIDHEKGKELTINDCNKKRNGIPIPASFTRYSREHFLSLSPHESVLVSCEAKQVNQRFLSLVGNKKVEIIMKDQRNCIFKYKEIKDINGDGLIIKGEYVYRVSDGDKVRETTTDDLKDLFFFQEADQSMAYIPMKYLEYETKE